MNFRDLVVEECDEGRDAAQLARLGLHRVVHVAEVLQISAGIGLKLDVKFLLVYSELKGTEHSKNEINIFLFKKPDCLTHLNHRVGV